MPAHQTDLKAEPLVESPPQRPVSWPCGASGNGPSPINDQMPAIMAGMRRSVDYQTSGPRGRDGSCGFSSCCTLGTSALRMQATSTLGSQNSSASRGMPRPENVERL
jgi:hypothetical protein